MGFASLSLEQGLQISVSVWNRVYFCHSDSGTRSGQLFCCQNRGTNERLLLFPLGSRCTFTQTRRFRLEGQPRLTLFSLEQGIYFHDFVWNRVAKLRLFSLEQGQVLRHSAAHTHPKLRGVTPPPGCFQSFALQDYLCGDGTRGGGGGGSCCARTSFAYCNPVVFSILPDIRYEHRTLGTGKEN